ncbi:MAG: SOS response-associated peptidase [Candidatus Izemoplasmatales bacterium]
MCGRFSLAIDEKRLREHLLEKFDPLIIKSLPEVPRYNIAPGQEVLTVLSDGNSYRAGVLKWGFVPPFAKSPSDGYKMINARSETVASSNAFRPSFLTKRCVIIADGFYEWDQLGKTKQPHRFTSKSSAIVGFAGLWTSYLQEDGSTLYTTTILTTSANGMVGHYHERMPVILDDVSMKRWLNPNEQDLSALQSLLQPYAEENMIDLEVSSFVNSPKNDRIECIQPNNQQPTGGFL